MSLQFQDRVWETLSNPGGSGTITLSNTPKDASYNTIASKYSTGDTLYYIIRGTTTWEIGIGKFNGGTSFTRDTVLSNSSGTTALITFTSGTYDLIGVVPAEVMNPILAYTLSPIYLPSLALHFSY